VSILKSWSPFFQSRDRLAGRALQTQGHVEQLPPDQDQWFCAVVRDEVDAMVVIHGKHDAAGATCTCTDFASGRYCKHIWATLVDIDTRAAESAANEAEDTEAGPDDSGGDDETPDAYESLVEARPTSLPARKRDPGSGPLYTGEPEWSKRLNLIRLTSADAPVSQPPSTSRQQLCYIVRPDLSIERDGLVVELYQRRRTAKGWTQPKPIRLAARNLARLNDAMDRSICAALTGSSPVESEPGEVWYTGASNYSSYRIAPGVCQSLIQKMIQTDRCFLAHPRHPQRWTDLYWDADQSAKSKSSAWALWLTGALGPQGLEVELELRRDTESMPINKPVLILGGPDGLVFYDDRVAPLNDNDAFRWVHQFREDVRPKADIRTGIRSGADADSTLLIDVTEIDSFIDRLFAMKQLPEIDLPTEVCPIQRPGTPVGRLELTQPGPASNVAGAASRRVVTAAAAFEYEGHRVASSQTGRFVRIDAPPDDTDDPSASGVSVELIRRDAAAEQRLLEDLSTLGFKTSDQPGRWTVLASAVPIVVDQLIAGGWQVLADQHRVHRPGPARFSVKSEVDWFELRGGFAFETAAGTQQVPLPAILAAVGRGDSMVQLDDGSQGLIPSQWLKEHELIAQLGHAEDDMIQFKTSQAALIDALLDQKELIEFDEPFGLLRDRIRQFEKIEPVDALGGFAGDLRPYQQYGLGWLGFLRWFTMGGVLADDMGLGKTIQVLALLHNRIKQTDPPQPKPLPTLVVAPRSVVFNWIDEAAHFTPNLKVLSYRGADRHALREHFDDYDLIVTSYGLMRRDIEHLHQQRFEYVVLDEAQMIKNPASQVSKASRLLQANHRLALTGTPVENHLGDLWSIVEFLNPGILGASSKFSSMLRGAGVGRLDDSAEVNDAGDQPVKKQGKRRNLRARHEAQMLSQLGKALRPLILRRTKSQVLKDLPEKTEQTLICRMAPAQRQVYDQLLAHYRTTLLGQSDLLGASGPAGPTMLVLEALLRLRQAACHPALIDPNYGDQHSAKLDLLMNQLEEVIDEGHKALVFSQFTSMLGLLRQRLDQMKIPYEYLDGRTHKRRKKVHRFQSDPMCPLFLISLKAGGFGLNLTAADYVFILDPWWNPAVEQQAIDRAHRIGQTRHVFAYRLICEDTVEQRIVDLQRKKRDLADAIVGQQENLLRSLSRDDLKLLLS